MFAIRPLHFLDRFPSFEKVAQALVFFLLATIPLLFGAVHPVVQGLYTLLILVGLGGWMSYGVQEWEWKMLFRSWLLVPTLLIVYLVVQSLPLPLSVIEWLSPARASRITMVNTLAQTNLTAVSLSDNGVAGLQNAIFVFSLLLYYLALTNLLRRNRKIITGILLVIAGVGLFEGLYGLLQMMNPKLGILWLPAVAGKAATGTIIYKNQYAMLLNMCWPLAFAGGLLSFAPLQETLNRSSLKKGLPTFIHSLSSLPVQVPFFFLSAGIMILALLFSFSRGGILSMVLLLVLLYLFMPVSRRMKLCLMGLLFVFLAGYGSLLGLDGLVRRFSSIDESGLSRFHIYASSFPLVRDHWLTGIGIDSFKLLSGVYLKGFPENLLFDRVHNDYLELAIEIGLPMAFVCFIWTVSGVVWTGKKIIHKCQAIQEKKQASVLVGCAAFCALLSFLIHGLVDFGWRLPANAVFVVTLLALISLAIRDPSRKQSL